MNKGRSKQLAYRLRHDEEYRFEAGGWREVEDLVRNHSFTREEICDIVKHDNKGRYQLNDDSTKVRALYGHSVKVDLLLSNDYPPESLYHGTAEKYLPSILKEGLDSRSRQFVHLTENRDTAVKTGARHGKPAVLIIDSGAMHKAGYLFHNLGPGIWVTKIVPAEYIGFDLTPTPI